MEMLICLSLLIVATATCGCDTLNNVDIESHSQNDVASPEYSRVNQQVTPKSNKTPNYTVPPLPKLPPITYRTVPAPAYVPPTKAVRRETYNKPVAVKASPAPPVLHKPAPTIRGIFEEVSPATHTYSVPKSIVQTYSDPSVNEYKDPVNYNNDYADPEAEPVEYQPEEYPVVPIGGPTYPPPVAVYNPYPSVIRRRYFTPTYSNRVYPRLYNIAPRAYRTLGYSGHVPLAVPSVRNFDYGYPPQPRIVRYGYDSPNIGYDNGIPQVGYNGFINGDYDEFLKKKK